MYVYFEYSPGVWAVGFYNPLGKWVEESVHQSRLQASLRVVWLNGEKVPVFTESFLTVNELLDCIELQFKNDENKYMMTRLTNILKYLSNRFIYVDQISEKHFFDTRNSGTKTWELFLEVSQRAKSLRTKHLEMKDS